MVSGTTTVGASASDNVGVAGVQFLLDGANLGAEDTASPYSIAWNTTTVNNGSHTLTAVARDAAGNRTTSAPVTVSVSNAGSSTRFEESSATLAPAGSWSGVTGASTGVTLSGDFAVIAPDTGATATFTFSGTGVSWIGFNCERCGIARVHLDGAVVATVDTYAPSRPAASGAIYSTTGLAAGNHTLVIEVTGTSNASSAGTFIVVDAFDVM
jgi:YD repeat-containing protein